MAPFENSTKCLSAHLYADLVGLPFVEGGRGPLGYDCVGLAREIQRRRGHTVPEFFSSEAELHRQIASGGFLSDCQRVSEPRAGCVALFKMTGHEHHLGTMVSRHRMVHTTAQTCAAVIESILGPLWERRIVGFYEVGDEPARSGSTRIDIPRLSPGLGYYPDPDEAAR